MKWIAAFCTAWTAYLLLGRIAMLHTLLFTMMGVGVSLLGLVCIVLAYMVFSRMS